MEGRLGSVYTARLALWFVGQLPLFLGPGPKKCHPPHAVLTRHARPVAALILYINQVEDAPLKTSAHLSTEYTRPVTALILSTSCRAHCASYRADSVYIYEDASLKTSWDTSLKDIDIYFTRSAYLEA
jgi:hypothetical protein